LNHIDDYLLASLEQLGNCRVETVIIPSRVPANELKAGQPPRNSRWQLSWTAAFPKPVPDCWFSQFPCGDGKMGTAGLNAWLLLRVLASDVSVLESPVFAIIDNRGSCRMYFNKNAA
jgi:hypothetical protein